MEDVKAKQRELSEYAQAHFKTILGEWFEENKDIVNGVRWTQYVPGFNDGEPCEFTLGEIIVEFKGIDNEEDYEPVTVFSQEDLNYYRGLPNGPNSGWVQNRLKEIERFLEEHGLEKANRMKNAETNVVSLINNIPENILQSTFGTDVEIKFNGSFQTEEYDCGY